MISPWKYHQSMKKMKCVLSKDNYPHLIYLSLINYNLHATVVRDSSAVRRLLWTCCSRVTSESSTYRKQQIFPPNLGFIFYQKPLYKSLHQSFFYSFITILPSESGVTLHYSTISPWTLWFCHFTSILKHLPRDFEKTTITAMYHGRWFAYKQTNKYFYCQS